MIERDLLDRSAKLIDICRDDVGYAIVWQRERRAGGDGNLIFCLRTLTGDLRAQVTIPCADGNAFPRLYRFRDQTWLAFRSDSTMVLWNLTAARREELGETHGNDPFVFADGKLFFQADPAFRIRYVNLEQSDWTPRDTRYVGNASGLSGWLNGPILYDDVRNSEPGMMNPRRFVDCTVGESVDGPVRAVAKLQDGRVKNLWVGFLSFTPRISGDGDSFAIVTTGGPGARLAILSRNEFEIPNWFDIDPEGVCEDFLPIMTRYAALKPGSTPQSGIACLNNEGWRSWDTDRIYFEYDLRGWYLVDAQGRTSVPWAFRRFRTGTKLHFEGRICDVHNQQIRPWRHTITHHVTKNGGVCLTFDPRFPGDLGPKNLYENHWYTSPWRRFEEFYSTSSESAILHRRVESPWTTAAPYREIPTRSLHVIPETPKMKSREQFYREFREVNDFYSAPEGLQRPGGMTLPGPDGIWYADVEAMGAWGYNLLALNQSPAQIRNQIRQSHEWRVKHPGEQPPLE